MTNEEKAKAFLKDLVEVCTKHQATIGGCGYCGSPFGDVGEIGFNQLLVTKDEKGVFSAYFMTNGLGEMRYEMK